MIQSSSHSWSAQLDEIVEALNEHLVEVRRHLHACPEVSGQEYNTTQYLAERLEGAGFRLRRGPDNRGLIADFDASGGSSDGVASSAAPLIALRADIDALRIQDAKSIDYRSRVDGVMHACGHDAHSAALLGATLALASLARAGALPWPLRVRSIFQPAEESNRGALEMIEAGALEGVRAIFALHADPSRPAGKIGLRPGALTADCDEVEVVIRGRGAHAARPHESLDPIAASAQFINALYLFLPRTVDAHDPVVITIGQITGGENANVIPERVVLRGTLRSLGGGVRMRTLDHMRQVARGIAEASGTQIDLAFNSGPPSVYNDRGLTDLVRIAAEDALGPGSVQAVERPSMGGEDFAHYLTQVPGCMFRLGCALPDGPALPLHSPDFDIDEAALSIGARLLARAAILAADPSKTSAPEIP